MRYFIIYETLNFLFLVLLWAKGLKINDHFNGSCISSGLKIRDKCSS